MQTLASLYWFACGVWLLIEGVQGVIAIALVGAGESPQAKLFFGVALGSIAYGIFAPRLALRVRKGIKRNRGALLVMSMINIFWVAIAYWVYLRFLLFGIAQIQVGETTTYIQQYPFVNYSHTSSPQLANNVAYILALGAAIAMFIVAWRSQGPKLLTYARHARLAALLYAIAAFYFGIQLAMVVSGLRGIDRTMTVISLPNAPWLFGLWTFLVVASLALCLCAWHFERLRPPGQRLVVVASCIAGIVAAVAFDWWNVLYFLLPTCVLAASAQSPSHA